MKNSVKRFCHSVNNKLFVFALPASSCWNRIVGLKENVHYQRNMQKENDFDTRWRIISGNPKHHVSWKNKQLEVRELLIAVLKD